MRKGRVVVALVAIVGALVWVAAKGLSSSLVYYKTPTELLQQGPNAVGERLRLGGLVLPGSVQTAGARTTFVVTDDTSNMTVIDRGDLPELFTAGQGVVVEGALGADGAFHADTVLVKHNGVYAPPSPGETPHSADVG
ncbi:MAG TPA: cytochrome c maturation protein CcmE [Actinomycetota bacterium]|nr:cytochrome c maturation protein CcmE [Actinomycetota bacterium]